jgi:hypothetical protein
MFCSFILKPLHAIIIVFYPLSVNYFVSFIVIYFRLSPLVYQKALEIFIEFKDKHAISKVLRNAKILAEESGDEGVLKEMAEMLMAHFSEEELSELLNSKPDS